MILLYVFLILFTAWMFWGWMVGESRDIRWMRNWCAAIFVTMAILICLGGGALISYKLSQKSQRESTLRFAKLLKERLDQGRTDDVKDALSHLAENPDEWSTHSPDVLKRLADVTEALQKTSRSRIAANSNSKSIQ